MHAYSKTRGEVGGYFCDNCGGCSGEPVRYEQMLYIDYAEGTPMELLDLRPGWHCKDCEQFCFECDDEWFFTIPDPDDIIWICGECSCEYDEEEEAVSCCK